MYAGRKIRQLADVPIAHHVVMESLSEYARPNDKISEMLKSGELVSLRRGLYLPGPESGSPLPSKFLIANHLRGPSYVSLESALYHWGMIPERVFEVSSVTLKSTKTYKTEIGTFSFQHLDSPYYSFGIQRVEFSPLQMALVATPEKALCDKIILTSGIVLRSVPQTSAFLLEDMRIDEATLSSFNLPLITSWIDDAPKKSSLKMLIKTIERL